jgi:hypothetical protein
MMDRGQRVIYGFLGTSSAGLSKLYYDFVQEAYFSPELGYSISIATAILAVDLLVNTVRNKEPYIRRLSNYVAARLNPRSHSSL